MVSVDGVGGGGGGRLERSDLVTHAFIHLAPGCRHHRLPCFSGWKACRSMAWASLRVLLLPSRWPASCRHVLWLGVLLLPSACIAAAG